MNTPILPKLTGTQYEIDRALLVRHGVLVQPEGEGIEGMFDHGHLGHGICNLNDFCGAATARNHDVHLWGACA